MENNLLDLKITGEGKTKTEGLKTYIESLGEKEKKELKKKSKKFLNINKFKTSPSEEDGFSKKPPSEEDGFSKKLITITPDFFKLDTYKYPQMLDTKNSFLDPRPDTDAIHSLFKKIAQGKNLQESDFQKTLDKMLKKQKQPINLYNLYSTFILMSATLNHYVSRGIYKIISEYMIKEKLPEEGSFDAIIGNEINLVLQYSESLYNVIGKMIEGSVALGGNINNQEQLRILNLASMVYSNLGNVALDDNHKFSALGRDLQGMFLDNIQKLNPKLFGNFIYNPIVRKAGPLVFNQLKDDWNITIKNIAKDIKYSNSENVSRMSFGISSDNKRLFLDKTEDEKLFEVRAFDKIDGEPSRKVVTSDSDIDALQGDVNFYSQSKKSPGTLFAELLDIYSTNKSEEIADLIKLQLRNLYKFYRKARKDEGDELKEDFLRYTLSFNFKMSNGKKVIDNLKEKFAKEFKKEIILEKKAKKEPSLEETKKEKKKSNAKISDFLRIIERANKQYFENGIAGVNIKTLATKKAKKSLEVSKKQSKSLKKTKILDGNGKKHTSKTSAGIKNKDFALKYWANLKAQKGKNEQAKKKLSELKKQVSAVDKGSAKKISSDYKKLRARAKHLNRIRQDILKSRTFKKEQQLVDNIFENMFRYANKIRPISATRKNKLNELIDSTKAIKSNYKKTYNTKVRGIQKAIAKKEIQYKPDAVYKNKDGSTIETPMYFPKTQVKFIYSGSGKKRKTVAKELHLLGNKQLLGYSVVLQNVKLDETFDSIISQVRKDPMGMYEAGKVLLLDSNGNKVSKEDGKVLFQNLVDKERKFWSIKSNKQQNSFSDEKKEGKVGVLNLDNAVEILQNAVESEKESFVKRYREFKVASENIKKQMNTLEEKGESFKSEYEKIRNFEAMLNSSKTSSNSNSTPSMPS